VRSCQTSSGRVHHRLQAMRQSSNDQDGVSRLATGSTLVTSYPSTCRAATAWVSQYEKAHRLPAGAEIGIRCEVSASEQGHLAIGQRHPHTVLARLAVGHGECCRYSRASPKGMVMCPGAGASRHKAHDGSAPGAVRSQFDAILAKCSDQPVSCRHALSRVRSHRVALATNTSVVPQAAENRRVPSAGRRLSRDSVAGRGRATCRRS
jgi:hypothetical protein